MDLLTFFLSQHAAVHASDVSGRVFAGQRVFGELSDDQMRMSAATAQGLEAGFIVVYQTLLANAPSVAKATELGYQPYATHLAVQLTSEGATRMEL